MGGVEVVGVEVMAVGGGEGSRWGEGRHLLPCSVIKIWR